MGMLSKSLVNQALAVLFLGCILLGVAASYSFKNVDKIIIDLQEEETIVFKNKKRFYQLETIFFKQVHAWKNLLIRGHNKKDYDKYNKIVFSSRPEILKLVNQIVDDKISEDVSENLEKFKNKYNEMVDSYIKGHKVFLETKSLIKADSMVRGVDTEPRKLLRLSSKQLIEYFDKFIKKMKDQLENGVINSLELLIVISFLVFCVIVLLILFKVKELKEMAVVANTWAKGDLSQELKIYSKDEVGMISKSFGAVREYLISLIEDVSNGAKKIDLATSDIVALTNEHAANTSEQASTIGEFSSSITEITSVMSELGKSTESISTEMEATNSMAIKGKNLIAGTVENMDTIQESNSNSLKKFTILGEKVDEIAKIMVSITAIADKTNLLSVNASIEAVKAGELGKGFNVVATEIRRLADQTMVASNEINITIQDIQKASSAAMMSMEKSTQTTELGIERVKDAWKSVEELVQNIIHISPQVFEMQSAIQQSVEGISSAEEAIYQINEGAIESKNTSGQYSKTAADLGIMAKNQIEKISVFKVK